MVLSLTSYNVLERRNFGWDNYIRLFMYDDVFPTAVRNTLCLCAGDRAGQLCAVLLLCLVINDMTPEGTLAADIGVYAPSISGNLFSIWLLFFSGDMYGYLNSYLMKIGLLQEPVVAAGSAVYVRYRGDCAAVGEPWHLVFFVHACGFHHHRQAVLRGGGSGRHPRPLAGAVVCHSADDGAAPDAVGGCCRLQQRSAWRMWPLH